MASIDLRNVYLHIPISLKSQNYLRLAVKLEGVIHHHLVQGLAVRAVIIAVIPYLNDLSFFAPSRVRLQDNLAKACNHLESLGWILNLQKSSLNHGGSLSGLPNQFSRTEEFSPARERTRFSALSMLQTNQLIIRQVM